MTDSLYLARVTENSCRLSPMPNTPNDSSALRWQTYYDEVASLAQTLFGLTLNDLADKRQLMDGFQRNESPRELVERLGVKYDLVRVDSTYW